MKWFSDCKTCEQGKKLYREYCRKYHPDNGSSGEELKEINVEFKIWFEIYKNIHENEKGETFRTKPTNETPEAFMDIIQKLASFEYLDLEICGSWLWITGNTYPIKDILTSFGCRWSRSKKKWFYTQDMHTVPHYRTPSMDKIRALYGSQKVNTSSTVFLN